MQLQLDRLPSRKIMALLTVGAFATLLGLEIGTREDGITAAELVLEVLELVLTVVAVGGVSLLALGMRRQHDEKVTLIRDLEAARVDGDGWRQRVQTHMNGLGEAIGRQFEQWKLTEAECEVALLVLKGFTHKEIAILRGTSEATVRQQARVAYEKAGLKGRAPFCAYFLEDLLPSNSIHSMTIQAANQTEPLPQVPRAHPQASAN
jgi:DNA-binding CsgD family transcriptional regulator